MSQSLTLNGASVATTTTTTSADTTSADTTATVDPDKKHIDMIHQIVDHFPFCRSKKEKAKYAIKLFDYIANDGLVIVHKSYKYKKSAIAKAYQLKLESDDPELIESIDNFLNVLGLSLNPFTVIDTTGDSELVTEIASEIGLQISDKQNKEYLEYFREYCFNNDVYTDSSEKKKEEMQIYFKPLMEELKDFNMQLKERSFQYKESHKKALYEDSKKKLLTQIFEKKNLDFKDIYMDMYYIWSKSAPKVNRYKKMCMFIDTNFKKI